MEQQRVSVGYIPDAKIEKAAYNLIGRYAQKFGLGEDQPIPVESILEYLLGLTFELEDLETRFGFTDVLGATWIGEKTVRIDESLDPTDYPKKEGRYHFTVAHELGHWELHRHLFLQDTNQTKLFTADSKPSFVCRSSTMQEPMEIHADHFAGFLLMPRDRVFAAWKKMQGELEPYCAKQELQDLKDMWGYEYPVVSVAKDMARMFKVSGLAMQIRLVNLRLIQTEPPQPDLFTARNR